MRIVLFAAGDFAIPTLRALLDPRYGRHHLALIVTQPDRGSGRGRQLKPTPVKAFAEEQGLDVICATDVNTPEMIARLADTDADLGLVIAFGQKIGPEVRNRFRHQCVNLHASLLPRYRGAAPFQWTVINGDEQAGVTVFRLVDRMDAGPIYVTRWTEPHAEERACELHDRLAAIGVDAVKATLQLLEDQPDFEPVPQDDSQATPAPKLSKQDGLIRFDQPARAVACRINGLWDWPRARCRFTNQSGDTQEDVTIALARVGDANPPADPPGTIDARRYVAAVDGYVEFLEIKPAGSRLMTMQDYVNGRHVQPGDRFETLES